LEDKLQKIFRKIDRFHELQAELSDQILVLDWSRKHKEERFGGRMGPE